MPLDPKMLNSVVRISTAGDLLGTGSIISVPSESIPSKNWLYVVTAHHVIRHQNEIGLEIPDPLANGELFPTIPSDEFRQPLPDVDLAIAPFPLNLVPRHQATAIEHFVPEGMVAPLGGEIFYLGIFARLDVPMARAATLGTIDIPIDQDGYRYRGDLVDCRSYRGFSGSPCFSVRDCAILDTAANVPDAFVPLRADGSRPPLTPVASVASFCGIFTAHYSDEALAEGVVSRYGVGIMLPCDYVRDALMADEAKQERRKADEDWKARKAAEGPPLENAGAEPSEFERFEDLTRKLVNTPKPEAEPKG